MHLSMRTELLAIFLGSLIATPAIAAEPAVSIRLFRSDTVVEPDGQTVQTSHVDIAVNNDAAARQEAQQALTFADDVERIELVEGAMLETG